MSASILNFNAAAVAQWPGRQKLVNKRRLPAMRQVAFPTATAILKTQVRKSNIKVI
jgi:hypothetical protein